MSKMEIPIWHGRIWRPPSLCSAFTRARSGFISANWPKTHNNTTLARKTVAHKLARACYYIMRDLVPFEAMKRFG